MGIRVDGLPSGVRPKEMRLRATIVRKDGRREDLGTVAYWHRNRFIRLLHSAHLALLKPARGFVDRVRKASVRSTRPVARTELPED